MTGDHLSTTNRRDAFHGCHVLVADKRTDEIRPCRFGRPFTRGADGRLRCRIHLYRNGVGFVARFLDLEDRP